MAFSASNAQSTAAAATPKAHPTGTAPPLAHLGIIAVESAPHQTASSVYVHENLPYAIPQASLPAIYHPMNGEASRLGLCPRRMQPKKYALPTLTPRLIQRVDSGLIIPAIGLPYFYSSDSSFL